MNFVVSFHKRRPFQATCLTILLIASAAQAAETRFIKPRLEVPVHTGQSDKTTAIAVLPMGTAVELVEEGKTWSRITMGNGTKGWVRTRYLDPVPMVKTADIYLDVGKDGQIVNHAAVATNLKEENQGLKKELAACTTDRSTLADKYQSLVGDPTSALHARTELRAAKERIETLQQQLSEIQIENTVLRKNQSIRWFFTGSMVLLMGWIMGRINRSNKKRRSSSLLS